MNIEDTLSQLDKTHFNDGIPGFRKILRDIRVRIALVTGTQNEFSDLRLKILREARGLRMVNDLEVVETLQALKSRAIWLNREETYPHTGCLDRVPARIARG